MVLYLYTRCTCMVVHRERGREVPLFSSVLMVDEVGCECESGDGVRGHR